jgi:hypothetical protein
MSVGCVFDVLGRFECMVHRRQLFLGLSNMTYVQFRETTMDGGTYTHRTK